MNVGVIGSGAIGPDLAYGFVSALAKKKNGRVFLMDIKEEALEAGKKRIRGYIQKGLERGKLSPSLAQAVEESLVTTTALEDLADCDYVLEAATEELPVKKAILKNLEETVRPDCLIGFATSGIPRAQIAAETKHPERCFVNHPFFPAWRSTPVEIVLSGEENYGARMLDTMKMLGKVPIVTSDVPCFAADDVFCNYCAEAARIYDEGLATPAQVDAIVNDAIGGGGPFNVMDLTRGNLLGVHCMQLMRDAPSGSEWFEPPPILAKQGLSPWIDRKNPGDPHYDEVRALRPHVLRRRQRYLLSAGVQLAHPPGAGIQQGTSGSRRRHGGGARARDLRGIRRGEAGFRGASEHRREEAAGVLPQHHVGTRRGDRRRLGLPTRVHERPER
jgi:enoyl-CoA hydratase/3-hydroxyacyl-CoA dehydrogenase